MSNFLSKIFLTAATASAEPEGEGVTADPSLFGQDAPAELPTETDMEPSAEAGGNPSAEADMEPSAEADVEPSVEAGVEPSVEADVEPSVNADTDPIVEPTMDPGAEPIIDPVADPVVDPAVDPSVDPSVEPLLGSSGEPLTAPTGDPAAEPGFFQEIGAVVNQWIAGFAALKPWQQVLIVCLVLAAIVIIAWFCYKMIQKKKQERLVGEDAAAGQLGMQAGEAGVKAVAEGTSHHTAQSGALPVGPVLLGKVHGIGDRKDQQDSFATSDVNDLALYKEKGFLAVVADGMGGLSNGGMVSAAVVRTCVEMFYDRMGEEPVGKSLLKIVTEVNRRVNRLLAGQRERSGSTMVTAIISKGQLYFLTVGDSRIYLYRQGKLICLNRPHVYAEELALRAVNGIDSLESVERDVQRDALTSYIGAGTIKHLDRNAQGLELVSGDKIMLASDGVFGTLSAAQMEQALKETPEKAAVKMEEAVKAAEKLRQDNYTAVILEYIG